MRASSSMRGVRYTHTTKDMIERIEYMQLRRAVWNEREIAIFLVYGIGQVSYEHIYGNM